MSRNVFFATVGLAFQAGASELERQFREPPANMTRPCVALTWDAANPDVEWLTRQLERVRDVGAGGVLVGVSAIDEAGWKTLGDALERARQLKLDVGLRDFSISTEDANKPPHARRLEWTWRDVDFGDGGSANLNTGGEPNGVEVARLAIPGERSDVLSHQVVDLAVGPMPTGGVWRVYRFAAVDMTPLQVDPFDRVAVTRHVNRWLVACQSRFGKTYGDTLLWYQLAGFPPAKAGVMWSDDLPKLFPKRSGLGLTRHLPALAGVAVGGETTAAYVRQRVAQTTREMWRERYGKTVNELVHEAGLSVGGRIDEIPADPVEAALYFRRPTITAGGAVTNILAAGGARALGRRYVIGSVSPSSAAPTQAAELLSFPWKHEADRLLADGATRLLLETGGSLPEAGDAFDQLREGCAYVHRCQVLLQQGEPVADMLVWAEKPLPALAGYSCDYANGVMLETALVRDGKLRLEVEREYGVLAVDAGMADDDEAKRLVQSLAERGVKVLQADAASAFSSALPVLPDFEWRSDASGLNVRFLHRRTRTHEIYFVVNDSEETGVAACTFRDAGKGAPARWEPSDGEIGVIEQDVRRGDDGRVTTSLFLAPHDACFVVFERGAK